MKNFLFGKWFVMMLFALTLVFCVFLAGCSEYQEAFEKGVAIAESQHAEYEDVIINSVPVQFRLVGRDSNFSCYVEPLTGVMYLWRSVGYSGGLTVMFDVDGSPLTYDRFCSLLNSPPSGDDK